MNGRFVMRFILSLVLLALLVGAGVMVYQLGVSQGLAASGKLALPDGGATTGVAPYPYYGPFFWHPWGFGWFPFGFIFPILGFFLVFALIRGLVWGGWRGRHFYRGGPGGFDPNNVPPQVAEWHRKMHEQEQEQK